VFQPVGRELPEKELDGVSERDFQVAEGEVKGVGVAADLGTKVDREEGAGAGFEADDVGDGTAEGGDEGLVDAFEVVNGGDEGKEVAVYKFLLGVPEAMRSLICQAKLVRM
jgi:hypothetical protein